MASLSKEGPKTWRVLFMDVAGTKKRKQIRIYNATKKQAEGHFRHIENLISAKLQGTRLDDVDAAWLGQLPDGFHTKLVNVGIAEPRIVEEPEPELEKPTMRLDEFLQDHIHYGRTKAGKQAAESTVKSWNSTREFLTTKLGPQRELSDITAEDAHQFRRWLDKRKINQNTAGRKGQLMAENSKRKHMANCKTFFNAAKRRGLIETNPFENQVSTSSSNRSRDYYVTPADAAAMLDAAPDVQWRLLIAFWRLAGLRKMEVFSLT